MNLAQLHAGTVSAGAVVVAMVVGFIALAAMLALVVGAIVLLVMLVRCVPTKKPVDARSSTSTRALAGCGMRAPAGGRLDAMAAE